MAGLNKALIDKAMGIMPIKKRGIRIKAHRWTQDRLFELVEVLTSLAARTLPQLARDHDAPIAIDRDQTAIEGPIKRRGEQEAICWIMAVLCVFPPWLDVAGREQSGIGNAGNAASIVIIRQNGSTEKFLPHALIHDCLGD